MNKCEKKIAVQGLVVDKKKQPDRAVFDGIT